jgi:hypothetical protein
MFSWKLLMLVSKQYHLVAEGLIIYSSLPIWLCFCQYFQKFQAGCLFSWAWMHFPLVQLCTALRTSFLGVCCWCVATGYTSRGVLGQVCPNLKLFFCSEWTRRGALGRITMNGPVLRSGAVLRPKGSYWHWLSPDLPPTWDQIKPSKIKLFPCDEGLSLAKMVNWQNLLRRLFRDKRSGDKAGELSQSRSSHLCQTSQKLTKAKRIF